MTTVPAFNEANRQRIDPRSCACRVSDSNIVRCPLHAAAPNLLAALEVLICKCPASRTSQTCILHGDEAFQQAVWLQDTPHSRNLYVACAAITAAKGDAS